MLKLLPFLKNYKKQCILGPLFKFTEAVFELIVPIVMAKIIDVGIKNNDKPYIFKMGGIMVALGVIGLVMALTAQYFAAQASQGFGTEVRNAMFKHIQKLSTSDIEKFGAPSLITRITNDINQLQVGVAMTIRLFLRSPFLIIGATIMSFTIDAKLALIFLITTPIIAFIIYIIMSRCVPYFKKNQKILDRISLITRENLSGIRVIRAFSKQNAEIENFNEANDDYMKTSLRVGRISVLLNPLTYVVLNLGIIAVIWFGGGRVYKGELLQGEIIALVNYMTQILLSLIVLANLVVIYMKSFASALRVVEVLNVQSSINDGEVANLSGDFDKIVEFKNVYFNYPDSSEPALEDITFDIKKGETIGIIGGTGSGKSTLINLIMRFYDITSGELLFCGENISKYKLHNLRDKIGLVPQKAVLFAGTLRENMQLGKQNATDEEIFKALEVAQAKEFVDKYEEKLDKKIEQKGKNLSGGQRQRLTIARAIVSEPDLLILDDSASALDFATDAKLRKAIYNLNKDMSVIIISQRATSIKNADKIIVMDDGKICGIGKHDELINTCEVYQEIYNSQNQTA
jgi:ATP-binding cassette subfamily B protein